MLLTIRILYIVLLMFCALPSVCCRAGGKNSHFSCYAHLILLFQLYCLQAGMIEFVGLIKVNVVRGTNLAVRDVVTSDPYVILSLGHQVRLPSGLFSYCYCLWGEKLPDSPAVIFFAVSEDTSYKE